MTRAPLLIARIEIVTDTGIKSEGLASDLLVPKWFEKDPNKTIQEDIKNLIKSTNQAAMVMTSKELKPLPVFDLWWKVYRHLVQVQDPAGTDFLVRGFGVALLERAVMDAVCRSAGLTFFNALKENFFDFKPEKIHPQLVDWNLSESLPDKPGVDLKVRHTVGLADHLLDSEIPKRERIHDGFPQTLEENIDRYGVTYFKVKISGNPQEDLLRLRKLALLVKEKVGNDTRVTLDGNEQYEDLNELIFLLHQLNRHSEGSWLLERLLFIEQPLPRTNTFDPSANSLIPDISEYAPVIIDEADMGTDAFIKAQKLGYRGVSVKTCKGVFRALLNRGLCELSDTDHFQSAEDLTNLPILSLQQHLATVAALGITHAELNGHHYFRGLDHLPEREAYAAASVHTDLYKIIDSGIVLNIQKGHLQTESIQTPGYGYQCEILLNERTPIEQWVYPN